MDQSQTTNKDAADAERYRTLKKFMGVYRENWTARIYAQMIYIRVDPKATIDEVVDAYTEMYRRSGK